MVVKPETGALGDRRPLAPPLEVLELLWLDARECADWSEDYRASVETALARVRDFEPLKLAFQRRIDFECDRTVQLQAQLAAGEARAAALQADLAYMQVAAADCVKAMNGTIVDFAGQTDPWATAIEDLTLERQDAEAAIVSLQAERDAERESVKVALNLLADEQNENATRSWPRVAELAVELGEVKKQFADLQAQLQAIAQEMRRCVEVGWSGLPNIPKLVNSWADALDAAGKGTV